MEGRSVSGIGGPPPISLPRWSPHIIHPTHYRRPRHKLYIHTHHTRSVRYSPIKSQPSFGFLWCTQCAYKLKCTIGAVFIQHQNSVGCTQSLELRKHQHPPVNPHCFAKKFYSIANCRKDITDPVRNILAVQTSPCLHKVIKWILNKALLLMYHRGYQRLQKTALGQTIKSGLFIILIC